VYDFCNNEYKVYIRLNLAGGA